MFHRHKPSKMLLVLEKQVGATRMVRVGARKCLKCGRWLDSTFDCKIVNPETLRKR